MGASQVRKLDDMAEHETRAVVSRTVTEEAETYNSSVAGIDLHAVRAGPGTRPSRVLAITSEQLIVTANKVGFPMFSQTTVSDDAIVLVYFRATPPGCRWCEVAVEPGAMIAYGPAAEHTARNLPGLDFIFAVTETARLEACADRLGIPIEPPQRGRVRHLAQSANPVGAAFSTFADAAASGEYPPHALADNVLRAMVHTFGEEDRWRRIGSARRIDSRHVVHECIGYAQAVQRIPSISEMCLAAHVSERRLRQAFTDEFDIPPSRFFLIWALNEARCHLAHKEHHTTVTQVATGLGFDHLGRFAGRYKQVFGESPSATLHPERRAAYR